LHPFAARETVSALVNWSAARAAERLLLVTSTGFARAYPLDALRGGIEAPAPFQFDSPPPGVPLRVQGVFRRQDVVIVTTGGRAVRWSLADIPLSGLPAINCGREQAFDRVAAAQAHEPDDELVLSLADGYARRLSVAWVFAPEKANLKGKTLVARQAPVTSLDPVGPLHLLTNRRLLVADGSELPLERSTKAHPLVGLDPEETIAAVVQSQ
jgi:hypothetical protein